MLISPDDFFSELLNVDMESSFAGSFVELLNARPSASGSGRLSQGRGLSVSGYGNTLFIQTAGSAINNIFNGSPTGQLVKFEH